MIHRALFVAGGLCVGGAAILMAVLADRAQAIFHKIIEATPYASFILTPCVFGLAAFLARNVFPNSQGSGIPQVIAATELREPKDRRALVSLKVAAGKVIVMMMGLAGGASVGREGPTVQVGAAIMAAFGRWAPSGYQAGLMLAGGAAGIAAAFNTPLAGIVFGIEELSQSFETRTSGLILACVIAAGITSFAIMGDYAYFGSTAAILPIGPAWSMVRLRDHRRPRGRPVQPRRDRGFKSQSKKLDKAASYRFCHRLRHMRGDMRLRIGRRGLRHGLCRSPLHRSCERKPARSHSAHLNC